MAKNNIAMETVNVKTAEDNFAAAFMYALKAGAVEIKFRGWEDDCQCASCRSQKIILNHLSTILDEKEI